MKISSPPNPKTKTAVTLTLMLSTLHVQGCHGFVRPGPASFAPTFANANANLDTSTTKCSSTALKAGGFWDTIGGLFTGDTYFPDNQHREARANQLGRDIQLSTAANAEDAKDIKANLDILNKKIVDALGGPASLPDSAKLETFSFSKNDWSIEVSEMIAPLIVYSTVTTSLETAGTAFLVESGEIGAAALASLVGLPVAFEAAIGVVAGVFAIGAVFGIGAIAGSVKRDKLRSAIHQMYPARTKINKAHLANRKLVEVIKGLVMAVDALVTAKVPEDVFIDNLASLAAAGKKEVDTAASSVVDVLATYDKSRHSWTHEDK